MMDDMQNMWDMLNKEEAHDLKVKRRNKTCKRLYEITDKIEELTEFHYRLFGKLDIYPTSRKYHNLITNKRGKFYSNTEMEEYINHFKI